MNYRTDLTIELTEAAGETDGVYTDYSEKNGVKIAHTVIASYHAAESIGKPQGEYYTLEMLPFSDNAFEPEECFEAASDILAGMLPKHGGILAVGLGNEGITPDSLGPKAAGRILATRHISHELAEKCGLAPLRQTSVIAPGVLGQTGIEAAEVIRSLVKSIRPSAVIVIDAMASRSLSRLGCTLQISDSGISPGSGVGNNRPRIDSDYLGTRVISMGVPTVVDMQTLAADLCGERRARRVDSGMIVSPREIDLLTDRAANFIGMAVNAALQPHIHPKELMQLF
ncbi:MAG: GPR endopeptidase [Firmicutes bacterium]|nr:GPR endopeptidase [Bacillota bacterium]